MSGLSRAIRYGGAVVGEVVAGVEDGTLRRKRTQRKGASVGSGGWPKLVGSAAGQRLAAGTLRSGWRNSTRRLSIRRIWAVSASVLVVGVPADDVWQAEIQLIGKVI